MKSLILVGCLAFIIATTSHAKDADLIAHEWGTFTSIQGSDGVLIEWNGVETLDLPDFIHNWTRPGLDRTGNNPLRLARLLSKKRYVGLQRMETPVIYFYTEQSTEVDVKVEFPQGYITEWFPQASKIGPSYRIDSGQAIEESTSVTNRLIEWANVQVLPRTKDHTCAKLLTGNTHNHYFAARETDANLLRFDSLQPTNNAPELERFLFYRGVGDFTTPLLVQMMGERIEVTNKGQLPLKHLFAITIDGNFASLAKIHQLHPGETNRFQGTQHLSLANKTELIASQMEDALTAEGLYPREAAAMVNTWKSTWFGENGTRVLYVLPRQWTDGILPIQIMPEPQNLVRVMVGRAEIITPETETAIRLCVRNYQESDSNSRIEVVARFKGLGLGRFASPAIDLVVRNSNDQEFTMSAYELLQASTLVQQNQTSQPEILQSSTGRFASKKE